VEYRWCNVLVDWEKQKGKIEEDFNNTKDSKLWINTDDTRKATPGQKNPGVE
jgi:hypothetical protein